MRAAALGVGLCILAACRSPSPGVNATGGSAAGGSGHGGASSGAEQGGAGTSSEGGTAGETTGGSAPSDGCGPLLRQGGSRVQPRVLVDDEGAEIPYDYFDVQIGSPCYFDLGSDHGWYCVPYGQSAGSCVTSPAIGTRFSPELASESDGVAVRLLVGDDGSRLASGDFFDLERQVTVHPSLRWLFAGGPQIGAARLLPQIAPLSAGWYSSTPFDCSAPADPDLLAPDGCNITDDTEYLTRMEGVVIDTPTASFSTYQERVFSSELADATAHWCFGSEGGPVPQSAEMRALRLTEMPLDAWKPVTTTRLGTGRFQYEGLQVGCFTLPAHLDWFIDTARGGELCQREDPSAQLTRCRPSINAGRIVFADDACSEQVVIHVYDYLDPEYDYLNPTGPRYALEQAANGATIYDVGRLLSEDVPVYYYEGDTCVPYPGSGRQFWPTFELLDAIPDEEFGSLRVELRP